MSKEMTPNNHLKKIVSRIGSLFAISSIIFVILRLHNYWGSINLKDLDVMIWLIIGLLSIFYAGLIFFLVHAWRMILNFYHIDTNRLWAIKAYGISQLGKYIPGNIFHIAGRQALAMASGLPGKAVFKSSIIELIFIASTGLLTGILILPFFFPLISLGASILIWVVALCIFSIFSFIYFGINIVKSILCYVSFLTLSSGIFIILLYAISHFPLDINTIISAGTIYTLAWLAGLVMPGAPAGIGVREFVVLFFLRHHFPESQLLLTVLLGRIVTVLGDVLFFLLAYYIKNNTFNMSAH